MKQYKIVRIAGLHYDTPMAALYKDNPELQLQSYAEQKKALFQVGYVYSDSFSRAMKSLGHDADEIVYDLETLQKAWAKEKGIQYAPDYWQYDIVLRQIEDLKPDVLYLQDIYSLPHDIRKNLKQEFPFIKLIVAFKGYPSDFKELGDLDLLFAGYPILDEMYRSEGIRTHLLYHAFDDAVLGKLGNNDNVTPEPKCDFTFLGSSGFGYGQGHQSRYWALVELIKRTNLELWVHDRLEKRSSFKVNLEVQLVKSLRKFLGYWDAGKLNKIMPALNLIPKGRIESTVRRLLLEVIEEKGEALEQNHGDATKDEQRLPIKPLHKMFPHCCHAPVFGLDMYRILRSSKVTFNIHPEFAVYDSAGCMRLFEATGVGTCLLTDTARNMSDLFEEDHEVIAYSSIEECIEKVNYLLEHEDIRRQIAAAGQRRTLKDHTVMSRCQQIDEVLQKML